jgi:beta-carotene hydroxylase
MDMSAIPSDNLATDLSNLTDAQLIKLERQIARKHSGMFPWLMVIWAFGNLIFWLSLWPLVFLDIVPLWLGFILATINVSLVYLPTHDAQHGIIARPRQKLRWLNELVGHATSWMIISPFNVLRVTHLEHHRHANDPELDPDYSSKATGPWGAIWKTIRERQPNGSRGADYLATLDRLGRKDLILLTLAYQLGYFAIIFSLAWSGYALEAFFLWWLPYHIAMTYLSFFLSWAPHHPGIERGRYRDTRSWKSAVGNIGSMGMQYHSVHHLHPYISLDRTPAAFREMRPILEARRLDLGGL